MSDFCELEKNFDTLKELFISLGESIQILEQQNAKLEKQNQTINEVNKSLEESMNRLLKALENRQTMLGNVDNSLEHKKLHKTQLDDVKRGNVILKDSFDTEHKSVEKLGNYIQLLQNKIVDLENQLVSIQTLDSSFHVNKNDGQVLPKLESKCNTLLIENKTLKSQLTNFRHLHNQIVPEIQLAKMTKPNDDNRQNISISTITIDALEQNELQPLQVNVIESDAEDSYIDVEL